MRKLYLEPEKPPETIEVEHVLDKSWWDQLKEFFGMKVEVRTELRKELRRAQRRWRWQTHAEVEEESGIIRHDEFLQ